MSSGSVLYDVPGPAARRRHALLAVAAGAGVLVLVGIAGYRLAEQGQFDADLWAPLLNPADDSFQAVWRVVLKGLRATLTAALLAIAFSLLLGTLLGITRLMLGRTARMPVVGFIELLRGLPVVISIYLASRMLPELGLDLSFMPGGRNLWYLVIGLTAYNSVILAEILRSGVNALPKGQKEAAAAIGLTEFQTMRMILLPQAVRIMLPALISQLVVILKDTSLSAVLGLYPELLKSAQRVYQSLDNPIQALFVVGLMFICINYALSRLATYVESRMARGRRALGADVEQPAEATAG